MDFLAQLHPLIVHFPIVLLFLYAAFEIAGGLLKKDFLSKSAHIILALAIISALAAVLTGDPALKIAEAWNYKRLHSDDFIVPFGLMHNHKDFATITLLFYTALLVIRTMLVIKKIFTGYFKYAVMLLAISGLGFVVKTGESGSELVYKHGIGTRHIMQLDSASTKK